MLFYGSCVEMQETCFERSTDNWIATRVWFMGHWLLQLLSDAVHAGTAGSGCLPLVGWRDGAGKAVKKMQVRDRKENRQRQTALWWLGVEVVQPPIWSFFKSFFFFQWCGRSGCVTGFYVCVCVCGLHRSCIQWLCVLHLRKCTCPHNGA